MIACLIFSAIATNPIPPFIAVDNYVYLAKRNGEWQYAAQAFPAAKNPIQLTQIGIGTVGGTVKARNIRGASRGQKAKIVGASATPGVLVYGLKPAAPRPFKKIDGQRCLDWVSNWLRRGFDIKTPVTIFAAYEGDLDGDGAIEQIAWGRICFEKVKKPPICQALLLRAHGRIYPIYAWDQYEAEYSLKAVADIDGDGRMEFITKLQGWGYSRATINFYRRGSYTQIPYKHFHYSTKGGLRLK